MKIFKRALTIGMVLVLGTSVVAPTIYAEESENMDTSVENQNSISESQSAECIEYIYIDQQSLTLGEQESIVFHVRDVDGNVEDATLYFMGPDGEQEIALKQNMDQLLLFQIQPDQIGSYVLQKLVYRVEAEERMVDFREESGLGQPQFEVLEPKAVNGEEDIILTQQSDEMETVGEVVLGNANVDLVSSGGKVVVVLDPGHDNVHHGAQGIGLREEEVNLKIAQYCRMELEKYNNVVVYMTREDGTCLNATNNGECMQARVNKAQSVGADLLVSIHADASSNPNATGSLAIVAGYSGYRDDLTTITQQAGRTIQSELEKLGLTSRGLYVRWSDSTGAEYVYPNGATADWYAITRKSMKAGLPGIIIEHGFISSAGDASRFLNDDTKLRNLGIADAEGIAKYFGLTKGTDVAGTLVDNSSELYTEDTIDIAGFIRRLYIDGLNREPSRAEVSYWLQQVAAHDMSGSQLAQNFVWSPEFTQKNLSNDEFVEQLYHIYLGRSSDPAGKSDWVGQLNRGISRNSIVWGFENSREFEQTCERYGIRQGSAVTKNAKLYTKVADFVANYYQGFLKREPDEDGLENWTTLLVNGGTAADLTKGFVFSPEFQNQNVNKEDFVECLYNTYLQRNSDAAGKQSWVQQLPTMSWSEKENVIKGFLYSQEYRELCEKYGIDIGNL